MTNEQPSTDTPDSLDRASTPDESGQEAGQANEAPADVLGGTDQPATGDDVMGGVNQPPSGDDVMAPHGADDPPNS